MAVLNASMTLPMTMTVASVTEKLMIRAAEASLTGDQPPGGVVRARESRRSSARTKAMKARPRRSARDDLFQARRNDIGGIEGDPDDPAAGDGRARAEDQHAERRQKPAARGRDRRWPDRAGRGAARSSAGRHKGRSRRRGRGRASSRTPSERAALKLLERIGQHDRPGPAAPAERPDTTFIQRLGLRMPSLCSNRARVKPARRRSPIWVLSCSAWTSRARPSRWVSSSSATAASRSARSLATSALSSGWPFSASVRAGSGAACWPRAWAPARR